MEVFLFCVTAGPVSLRVTSMLVSSNTGSREEGVFLLTAISPDVEKNLNAFHKDFTQQTCKVSALKTVNRKFQVG